MKTIIVIPARWDSSRFKGKPLALIKGITMLERVWKKAKLSKEANDVIVATDNKKIWNFCKKNQFKVIMTSKNHKTGTDRISEVSKKINANIYVNLQGDEPLINPRSIDAVIRCLKKKNPIFKLDKLLPRKDSHGAKSDTIACESLGKLVYSKNRNLWNSYLDSS